MFFGALPSFESPCTVDGPALSGLGYSDTPALTVPIILDPQYRVDIAIVNPRSPGTRLAVGPSTTEHIVRFTHSRCRPVGLTLRLHALHTDTTVHGPRRKPDEVPSRDRLGLECGLGDSDSGGENYGGGADK